MLALYLWLLIAPHLHPAAVGPGSPSVSRVEQAQAARAAIPRGQIVAKVSCTQAPAQSYALYLPANYDAARRWPILYAFDPGARGKAPVERYREAAERFGWIIAGSDNSRNGNLQASLDAWNA